MADPKCAVRGCETDAETYATLGPSDDWSRRVEAGTCQVHAVELGAGMDHFYQEETREILLDEHLPPRPVKWSIKRTTGDPLVTITFGRLGENVGAVSFLLSEADKERMREALAGS